MTQLQSLIQKGESEHLEFKASFGKEAIEALCAFANTRGGTVLIGINDKGKIAGVQASRESIQKWINQFIENSNRFRDYPINDDPLTVLKKFELLRGNTISFGCFLMFGKNPSMIATIDAGRFDSEIIIKDSVTIRDDLFSEVEACMGFVRKHISKRFVISGKVQRDEAWEYPQRSGNN